MIRSGRYPRLTLLAVGVTLVSTLLLERSSAAYNGSTHHSIVSLGWEVMRAAADPQFGNHIAWTTTPPAPLSSFGSCEFCGSGATAAGWSSFLARIPTSMARLNGLDPALSDVPCTDLVSDDGTLKGIATALDTGPSLTDPRGACPGLGQRRQGGAPLVWHPGGIFDTTTPNAALDGNGFQGLYLGYHAKTGDDHLDDTTLESLWLIFGKTVGIIIGVLIAIGLVVALFASGAIVAVIALALLFCIIGIFDGDGCPDAVVSGFTSIIEAAAQPSAALNNAFPELSGILPRGGDIQGSTYTGMWHFIRAQSGGANDYDDREGLNYDDASIFYPGQCDIMAQAGLDLGDLHLGYDESQGIHRYEIIGGNDGHPDSRRRNFAKWQGPTAGHLQFAPLDNFAFHGWSHFLTTPNAHWLSWPLHALGDATVPMHVTGTSSWGHRPYEDALGWSDKWNLVRFMKCVPENGSATCAATCMVGAGDPATKTCPEATAVDDNSQQQFEQARRILQHAFRWSRFIADWRTRMGRPTDLPMRDMITALAGETLGLSNPTGGDNQWPWCDDCSVDYLISKDHNQGKEFYETDDSITSSRKLIERSSGAVVAFLVAAGERLPLPPAPPACSNTTCTTSASCCGGRTCANGRCCRPLAARCDHDSDCCTSVISPLVCRNAVCVPVSANVCQQAAHSCEDGAAVCCADSSGARQCGTAVNGVSICCNGDGATCRTGAECCNGSCIITVGTVGVCKRPVGAGCTAASQCEAGSLCENNGVPVSGGTAGTCCNPSTTGALDCNQDSDCCTGKCVQTGPDDFKCQCLPHGAFCQKDLDCCTGNSCQNGRCLESCGHAGTSCQTGTQCCSGGCSTTNACICEPTGTACGETADCCAGNVCCDLGDGHPSCRTSCVCQAPGASCQANSDCCAGTLCCASLGFTCAASCPIACTPSLGACQTNADCCSGSCRTDQVCQCRGINLTCTANNQCCTNNCRGGNCSSCLAPQVDCNGQCCPGGTQCCGTSAAGQPICRTNCDPPPR